MPTHDLTWQIESVEQKIMRAFHHLEDLMPRVRSPVSRELYAIDRDLESDERTEVFRFRERDQPPPEIVAILGDFIANCWSALNHITFALYMAQSGIPSPDREEALAFPLIIDDKGFEAAKLAFEKFAKNRLEGIDRDAITIIERNQPYHTGNAAFRWLYELARIDRHRRLNVCYMTPSGISWYGEPNGTWTQLPSGEGLEDGTVIGRFRWNTEPDPDMDFTFTCQPAVSDGRRVELLSRLGPWIFERVKLLRDELAPYMLT